MGSPVKQPPTKKAPVRRPRRRLFLVALLLALIGFGVYTGGRHLWGEYHLRLAYKALDRREFAEARGHFAEYLKVWPDNAEIHLLAARAARRAREYDEAGRLLSQYRKLGGGAEYAQLERAMAHVQRGELAGEEGVLWTLVNDNNEDAPLALEALAQGYAQLLRWNEAIDCLNRLEKYWPDDPEVYLLRGWAHESLRERESATSDFSRVLKLKPAHTDAHIHLGEILLAAGLPEEAVGHLEKASEARPDEAGILRNLARSYIELGRFDEAEKILQRLYEGDANAPLLRGTAALKREQLDVAEKQLRRAIAMAPWERDAHFRLAVCLQLQGKQKEAAQMSERVRELEMEQIRFDRLFDRILRDPTNQQLRVEAGEILFRNGQEKEALSMLQSVVRAAPRHREANRALADYYRRIGDTSRAEFHQRQVQ